MRIHHVHSSSSSCHSEYLPKTLLTVPGFSSISVFTSSTDWGFLLFTYSYVGVFNWVLEMTELSLHLNSEPEVLPELNPCSGSLNQFSFGPGAFGVNRF